jgi:hypothetical protein
VTVFLPEWDGGGTRGLLPDWALKLSQRCTRYTFTTTCTHGGRFAVVAERVTGTGPSVVITSSEDEMRAALGLKPRKS